MKRKLVLAVLLLIAVLAIACPSQVVCPIHPDEVCYFTGITRRVGNDEYGVYRCARNHDVLARCN